MKKSRIIDLVAAIIWLLPILYLINRFPKLPVSVPLHFRMDGAPDRYGNKQELVWGELVLSIVTVGIYLLVKYLPKIDPKKTAQFSTTIFQKIAIALVILFSGIQYIIILASSGSNIDFGKLFIPLIGLFFTYLGYILPSVKPNYFVGIRTPWTLEDDDTWRATHQLGSKLWLIGGMLILLFSLSLPAKMAFISFIITMVIMVMVPLIYSYAYFKKHQK